MRFRRSRFGRIRQVCLVALLAVVLAGCGLGREYPATTATPKTVPAVVLLGDSLLAQARSYLPGALGWYGVTAPIVDHSAAGIGLLDDGFADGARTALDAAPPASIVVIQYSGNCFSGPGGVCLHPPGSDAFYEAWRVSLTQLVADVRERGHHPLLVTGPRFDPAVVPAQANVTAWVAVIALVVARDQSVPLVDWGDAVHDVDRVYRQFLWYADVFAEPALHVVRLADGVHLAPDGARRVASWTAHAVATVAP